MSSMCAGEQAYTVSSLAKRMHDFPHRNRDFETVSSVFDPGKTEYLEGAAFSSAVFLIVGIAVFLLTIVYLVCCCLCCKPDSESEKRQGCHWAFLVGSCVIIGAGLIIGYYGNEDTKKGIVNAADAIISANKTVSSATKKVTVITSQLGTARGALERLKTVWKTDPNVDPVARDGLVETTQQAVGNVDSAREKTRDITKELNNIVDVAKYANDMKDYDAYRWKGTIGALCFIILILLLVVLSILFSMPRFLKLIAGISLFALILMWLASGVFVSVAVLGGDFCVDPNGYVDRVTANKSYEGNVRYYVYCGNCTNPLGDEYDTAQTRIGDVRNAVVYLSIYADSRNIAAAHTQLRTINSTIDASEGNLTSVFTKEVNCPSIHKDYNSILSAVCSKTLDGATYTFAGALIIGIMLSALVMAAQGYWRRLEVEDGGCEMSSGRSRRRFKRDGYKMKRRY